MNKTAEKPKTETNITLKNVRLSFPNIHEPRGMKNADGSIGKVQFSAVALLNKKEHAEVIAQIEKLTERTALEKFGKKVTLKHTPLRDGADKEDVEGYGDDIMFITAKSEQRPAVVDRDKTPLVKADAKPYAGCYVNMGISLFAYSHQTGGKGVSASLRWVQFVRDGASFGAGRVDVDKEIEEVTDDDVSNY